MDDFCWSFSAISFIYLIQLGDHLLSKIFLAALLCDFLNTYIILKYFHLFLYIKEESQMHSNAFSHQVGKRNVRPHNFCY